MFVNFTNDLCCKDFVKGVSYFHLKPLVDLQFCELELIK